VLCLSRIYQLSCYVHPKSTYYSYVRIYLIIVLFLSQLLCYVRPNYRAKFVPTIVLRSSQLSCYVRPNYCAIATFVPNYHATFVSIIMLHSSQLSCYNIPNLPNYRATSIPTIMLCSFLLSRYQLSYYVHPYNYDMFNPTITTFQLLYYVRPNYRTMFVNYRACPNYNTTFVLTMLRSSLIYLSCYVHSYYSNYK